MTAPRERMTAPRERMTASSGNNGSTRDNKISSEGGI